MQNQISINGIVIERVRDGFVLYCELPNEDCRYFMGFLRKEEFEKLTKKMVKFIKK
jgi:hypothetical protein